MSVTELTVSRDGGPVSVRVTEHRRAHGVVSVVWRFQDLTRSEGVVGEMSRELPQVPLGAPNAVDGKGFLVDGFVVPTTESPSPYQVVVTVLQGGRELHKAVPLDRGTGTFGPEEGRFRYPFVVRVG